MAKTTYTYNDFFTAVLKKLNVTPRKANLRALAVMSIIEGTNSYWNPLNTVIPYDGSKNWNSVGVQMYKNFNDGVEATAQLLQGTRWTKVVASMRTAKTRIPILRQFAAVYAQWGSKPNLMVWTFKQAQARLDMLMPGQ